VRAARYPLISLLAAGLALLLGFALGVGPLASDLQERSDARVQRLAVQRDRLDADGRSLRERLGAARAYGDATVRRLVAGTLDGRTVAVVAAPDADAGLLAATVRSVRLGGAQAQVVVRLEADYVDPGKASTPLEDLALRLVPPEVEFDEGATPIERVGTVLARSLVRPAPDGDGTEDPAAATTTEPDLTEGAEPVADQAAAELLAGLEEIGALTTKGRPGVLADLAVLVTGGAGPDGEKAADRGQRVQALTGLAVALDAAGQGTVVVGPPAATGTGGVLRAVRGATGDVSTVGALDPAAGQVAVALALAEQAAGGSGRYGSGRGADKVLPPAPTEPTEPAPAE
jgi:hypothetical protein